jgi:hypothetical protein
MGRPRRTLVLTLHADEWDVLVAAAGQAERDPWQHARFLVRRGLSLVPDDPTPDHDNAAPTGSPLRSADLNGIPADTAVA